MLRFLVPVLLFAFFGLSAAAAQAPAPEHPADTFRHLLEGFADLFRERARGAGRDSDVHRRLRRRLESEDDPARRCALLDDLFRAEASQGNFRQAMTDLEARLAGCALSEEERREGLLNLGRLAVVMQPPDYGKAVKALREYAASAKTPDPDAHLYLGQTLAFAGRYDEAAAEAQRAMKLSGEPREEHYLLLTYCRAMQEDWESTAALLEEVVARFPLRYESLAMLAGVYHQLGREREAFLTLALAQELDLVHGEDQLKAIAYLYIRFGNPDRAARMLSKEMAAGRIRRTPENLELLASFWTEAREHERALLSLIAASRQRTDGELDFKIALIYFDDRDWDQAETWLRRALGKGRLSQPCTAQVLLGYALWYANKPSGALAQFERTASIARCKEEAVRSLRAIAAEIVARESLPHGDGQVRSGSLFVRIVTTLKADERALAASAKALEAARKAQAAGRPDMRAAWLSDYRRARAEVRSHLDGGALHAAREDRAALALLRAGLPADRVPPETLRRVRRLDSQSRRRVALLEAAEKNLHDAEEIAAAAGAKAESVARNP